MKDLIARIFTLRSDAHNIGESLTSRFGPGDDRPACFGMIFNQATMGAEMLGAYRRLWAEAEPQAAHMSEAEIEETRHENAHRVVDLTKWMFIGMFSSVEYCMRQTISKIRPSFVSQKATFATVTQHSAKHNIIAASELPVWDFLREVRNCTVHNNTIGREDTSITIEGRTFSIHKDRQMHDKLDVMVIFASTLMKLMKSWSERFS